MVVYEIMASEQINGKPTSINGEITLPGDKSISHRAVILGSLASGVTNIEGFLKSEDTFSTIKAMQLLGSEISWQGEVLRIKGCGLHGLKKQAKVGYPLYYIFRLASVLTLTPQVETIRDRNN